MKGKSPETSKEKVIHTINDEDIRDAIAKRRIRRRERIAALLMKEPDEKFKFFQVGGSDSFPYPYVYKPPKPPDDLSLLGQGKAKTMLKQESVDVVCQYCGIRLSEETKGTHVCRKKPE